LQNLKAAILHCDMIDGIVFSGAKAEPITALVGVVSRGIPE
jgi:hypothetical protein